MKATQDLLFRSNKLALVAFRTHFTVALAGLLISLLSAVLWRHPPLRGAVLGISAAYFLCHLVALLIFQVYPFTRSRTVEINTDLREVRVLFIRDFLPPMPFDDLVMWIGSRQNDSIFAPRAKCLVIQEVNSWGTATSRRFAIGTPDEVDFYFNLLRDGGVHEWS